MSSSTVAAAPFITPDRLLEYWQGHRALTRRVIDAFPEDQLFSFSVGGMRPFGQMAAEFLAMTRPMVQGAATGEWESYRVPENVTKQGLLEQWDEDTRQLNELWSKIPAARFQETMTAFGQYTGPLYDLLLYVVDNEIHHRGQGYVYLRALGIEPPAFWER